MKKLTLIAEFDLKGDVISEKDKDAKAIFDGERRKMMEVKLRNNAVLSKHKAAEPITVFCLSGNGTFHAGEDLSETQKLRAGTLITLEPDIFHEVTAEPELHILVTKFKKD